MECQHDIAVAVTCFWAHAYWEGGWNWEMRRAWRRHVVEATSWSKIRSIVCAVFLERSDVGVMWSQWCICVVMESQAAVETPDLIGREAHVKTRQSKASEELGRVSQRGRAERRIVV